MKKLLLLSFSALALAGCAAPAGPLEVELGATAWKLDRQGKGEIAVAVHDQRPAVVGGSQEANESGKSLLDPDRPVPIRTKGGDLAANILGALEKGLRAAGYGVRRVITPHTLSEKQARAALKDAEVSLLVVVRQWDATLKEAMAVRYHVTVHLIEGGRGERAAAGNQGQRGFDPCGDAEPGPYAQRCEAEALRRTLESLFAQPELKGALPSAAE